MLVLILIIAAWTGWQVNRARAVRRAIHAIERAGGIVRIADPFGEPDTAKPWFRPSKSLSYALGEEYFYDFKYVAMLNKGEAALDPETMRAISSLSRLTKLLLIDKAVGGADMIEVGKLSELEWIMISDAGTAIRHAEPSPEGEQVRNVQAKKLTSVGLEQISRLKKIRTIEVLYVPSIDASVLKNWSKLPNLRELVLFEISLKDDELQALGDFTKLDKLTVCGETESGINYTRTSRPLPIAAWHDLRYLRIASVSLKSDEIRAISQLSNLETLWLESTDINDNDLLLLRELRGLKELILRGSNITPETIASLKTALPNLRIIQ